MPSSNDFTASNENDHIANFLRQLGEIPWFAQVGKPIQSRSAIQQMSRWDQWPGPEDPRTSELAYHQQALHDEMMDASAPEDQALSELWDTIHATVVTSAAKQVPYHSDEDAWYAPNVAVWHAAWTAGLLGLCRFRKRPVPEELQEQWNWFVQGHWPYGWLGDPPGRKMLVY
jgi:hypothetical protein